MPFFITLRARCSQTAVLNRAMIPKRFWQSSVKQSIMSIQTAVNSHDHPGRRKTVTGNSLTFPVLLLKARKTPQSREHSLHGSLHRIRMMLSLPEKPPMTAISDLTQKPALRGRSSAFQSSHSYSPAFAVFILSQKRELRMTAKRRCGLPIKFLFSSASDSLGL